MKNKISFNIKYLLFFVILAVVCSMCMFIISVEQPSTAGAGSTMTVTLQIDMKPEQNNNNYLVLGVLVPKDWNVANSGTASFDSDYDFDGTAPASGNMRVAGSDFGSFQQDEAKNTSGKTGNTWAEQIDIYRNGDIGENYGAVEWVVFISENRVKVREDEDFSGTITVTIPVGSGHTGAQLGYFLGNANHGLKIEDPPRDDGKGEQHFDFFFTDCMTITGASGEATDLCGPAPTNVVAISPEGYLFNDIITIKFDAKEGIDGEPTALNNAGAVFLCATAVLADGSTKIVCDNNASAQMSLAGNNIWELTMWPTGYFGLSGGQVMTELHMNFQNPDGSIIVLNPTNNQDVVIVPQCN